MGASIPAGSTAYQLPGRPQRVPAAVQEPLPSQATQAAVYGDAGMVDARRVGDSAVHICLCRGVA
jgi:hypothetical protein